jgi:hypothetical protein
MGWIYYFVVKNPVFLEWGTIPPFVERALHTALTFPASRLSWGEDHGTGEFRPATPRPLHEETTALGFQADQADPQAGAPLGLYSGPQSVAAGHPWLKGYEEVRK